MTTNTKSRTTIHEIADGIYRISTPDSHGQQQEWAYPRRLWFPASG